jgi:hypothetical protein
VGHAGWLGLVANPSLREAIRKTWCFLNRLRFLGSTYLSAGGASRIESLARGQGVVVPIEWVECRGHLERNTASRLMRPAGPACKPSSATPRPAGGPDRLTCGAELRSSSTRQTRLRRSSAPPRIFPSFPARRFGPCPCRHARLAWLVGPGKSEGFILAQDGGYATATADEIKFQDLNLRRGDDIARSLFHAVDAAARRRQIRATAWQRVSPE